MLYNKYLSYGIEDIKNIREAKGRNDIWNGKKIIILKQWKMNN